MQESQHKHIKFAYFPAGCSARASVGHTTTVTHWTSTVESQQQDSPPSVYFCCLNGKMSHYTLKVTCESNQQMSVYPANIVDVFSLSADSCKLALAAIHSPTSLQWPLMTCWKEQCGCSFPWAVVQALVPLEGGGIYKYGKQSGMRLTRLQTCVQLHSQSSTMYIQIKSTHILYHVGSLTLFIHVHHACHCCQLLP